HKLALGHNADDQVETLLINLFRGSGLRGLKGMLPIRDGRVIRPLLETWRDEIESFALHHGIPYLIDSSNLQKRYLRNKIRLDLIPLIEKEYFPNFKVILNKISKILREENDCLERETEKVYQRIVREEKDVLSLSFSEYQSLHPSLRRRFLKKLLESGVREELTMEGKEGWPIDSLIRTLNNPSHHFILELPQSIYLEKNYDTLMLKKGQVKQTPPFEVELSSFGKTSIKEIGHEILVEEVKTGVRVEELKASPRVAFFDFQSLKFPLKVRNFRPGDRFQPLGVKGTQKLKEFFIDHKIPRFERTKIPLLISGEMIAWVVGYRINEKVKVTEKTDRVLRVEFI
ncbi:MAG: tRNA lysidine(34) synthetase TilS, partial [Thermodesulfobacteriota bacterium]